LMAIALPPCAEGRALRDLAVWHGAIRGPPTCSLKGAENSVNLAAGR
jgi:hypothetical protein